MTAARLEGRRVAILATDGVEQSELIEPREALQNAGAETRLLAPRLGAITAYRHDLKGKELQVDAALVAAHPDEYDALLLPGGVFNVDRVRVNRLAVDFVVAFGATGRPIAAIGHAPWLLIEGGCVRGHTVTSWPSVKTDLRNAGATWVDREVVVDGALITSRRPEDIPAFCVRLIEELAANEPVAAARGHVVGASAGHSATSSVPGGLPRYGGMAYEPPPYRRVPFSPGMITGDVSRASPYMRQR